MKEFVPIIEIAHKAGVNPALMGRHGIGKTAIVKGLEELGYGVVPLIASQLDASTVGGYPTKVPMEDGRMKMIYAIPDYIIELEKIAEAGLKPALFLDEFNRGDKFIENAFMTLVLDKEINGHKLPKGTLVISAMNPEADDDLGVNELTAPMMDRFAFLITEADSTAWLKWAKGAKVNTFVTDYIQKERDALTGFPFTEEMKATYLDAIKPTPRSWDAVGRILDVVTDKKKGLAASPDLPKALTLIRGLIGNEHTLALETHIKDTDLAKFTTTEILEASDETLARVADLIERNQTQVIMASLEDAHTAIGKKYKGELTDAAIKELAGGFNEFMKALPVDIAATFFAIEDEYEQFFTNLIIKDDFPADMVDVLVA